MAIPLSMPNSDEIDDSYRLDLLLEQLLITLRQVLIHRRRVAAAAALSRTPGTSHVVRHRHDATERTNDDEERARDVVQETRVAEEVEETTTDAQFPLPDLVMDSSASGKESPRTCHVERRYQCYHHHRRLHSGSSPPTSWFDDGGEMIRLADHLLHQVRSTTKEP